MVLSQSCKIGNKGMVLQPTSVPSGQPNMALLAPAGAPGVPYNPYTVGLVSNGHNRMVQHGGAAVGEYTRPVQRPIRGIHADGDRASCAQGLLDGFILKHGPGFDRIQEFLGVGSVLAGALAASVSVLLLQDDPCIIDVVKSPFWPCTAATQTLEALLATAVHKLLFGEALQGACGDGDIRLKGAGGREGPAGTAATLVFNGVQDCAGLVSPVDFTGDFEASGADFVYIFSWLDFLHQNFRQVNVQLQMNSSMVMSANWVTPMVQVWVGSALCLAILARLLEKILNLKMFCSPAQVRPQVDLNSSNCLSSLLLCPPSRLKRAAPASRASKTAMRVQFLMGLLI